VVRAVAAAAGRPVIVAIHATIGPGTAAELAAEVAHTGAEVMDAPVSGGFMGAQDGRLAVMVGGSRAAYERCREPFGCWADLIMHMGPVGAGTRAKLARNLLHFAAFTAAAEAQRLAEAAGVDLRKLGRVVRHSDAVTGGAGAIMLRPTTAPLDTDDPLREILEHVRALGEKDLSLALDLGAGLGVDLPMARLALGSFAAGLGLPPGEPGRPAAEIWTRPGLSVRDRRLLLLGLLTGQNQQDVADIQIGAALRTGELSPDELREIAIFLTHYAGWPSGARLSMAVEKLVGEHARAQRREQAQQRERHPDT